MQISPLTRFTFTKRQQFSVVAERRQRLAWGVIPRNATPKALQQIAGGRAKRTPPDVSVRYRRGPRRASQHLVVAPTVTLAGSTEPFASLFRWCSLRSNHRLFSAILPGSRNWVARRADAPGYTLPCLRHLDVVLAIYVAIFVSQPSLLVAQDDAVDLAEVQEIVGVAAIMLGPAGPVRDKDAPLEFLKPLINAEISFIKRVCEPSDEQMTAIIAAATKAYNATGDMVRDPNQLLAVGNHFRFLGPRNELLNQNPYHRIREDAAIYLQPIITAEQYVHYQTESNQREQFERGAIAALYVGLINAKIPMTEQQQAEMRELMMADQDDLDIECLQVYVNNPQYLPNVPAQVANKVFTKKQLAAWKSLNAGQLSFSTRVGNNSEMSIAEEWIK